MSNINVVLQGPYGDTGLYLESYLGHENEIFQVNPSGTSAILSNPSVIIANILPSGSFESVPIFSGNSDPVLIESGINIVGNNFNEIINCDSLTFNSIVYPPIPTSNIFQIASTYGSQGIVFNDVSDYPVSNSFINTMLFYSDSSLNDGLPNLIITTDSNSLETRTILGGDRNVLVGSNSDITTLTFVGSKNDVFLDTPIETGLKISHVFDSQQTDWGFVNDGKDVLNFKNSSNTLNVEVPLVLLSEDTGFFGLQLSGNPQSNIIFTLPDTTPNNGDVLAIEGNSGVMVWNPAPSMVLLSSQDASSSNSIVFPNVDSTYSSYKILFRNIILSANTNDFVIQFSIDNGSTFISTNYYGNVFISDNLGNNAVYANNAGVAGAFATYADNSIPGININGEVILYNMGNSASYPSYSGFTNQLTNSVGPVMWFNTCGGTTTTSVNCNAFQLAPGVLAGGVITSGNVRLYGIL